MSVTLEVAQKSAADLRESLCCYARGARKCDCKFLGNASISLRTEQTGCCEALEAMNFLAKLGEDKQSVKQSEHDSAKSLARLLQTRLQQKSTREGLTETGSRRLKQMDQVIEFLEAVQPKYSAEDTNATDLPFATRRYELSVDGTGRSTALCVHSVRRELRRLAELPHDELAARLKDLGFVHLDGTLRPCPPLHGMSVFEVESTPDTRFREPGFDDPESVYVALPAESELPAMVLKHTLINRKWDDLFLLPVDSRVWYRDQWLTLPELRTALQDQ